MRRPKGRRSGQVAPIGAALDNLVSRSEGRTRVRERLAALVWRDAVGDFYAERTRVNKVRHAIMWVWCDSPALAHQLSLDAKEIIRRINTELSGPVVKEIRTSTLRRGKDEAEYEVGLPEHKGPTKSEFDAVVLTQMETEAIDREAATIENEAIRKRFRQAAISERRMNRWRMNHGYRKCAGCGWMVAPEFDECKMCGREVGR